jgi:hypothetical protein
MEVKEAQYWKAQLPMSVRLAGSLIDVNKEQSSKALSPRLVRPAGSSIEVMDVFSLNAYAGTHASPWRSAHAASSMSVWAALHPPAGRSSGGNLLRRMHARTPSIGYE